MSGYNFTERMRKVLAMTREEAVELGHDYVSTQHILLGIIAEGEGNAATVMRTLGVDLRALAERVKALSKPGQSGSRVGPDLPYTSAGKKVLELAMSEARDLDHPYVGTEHLLLGLVREAKGVAAQALGEAGVELSAARTEIERLVSAQTSQVESARRAAWDRVTARRIDRVEISLRFHDGEVKQRSFASAREAAEYLWRGGAS
jgi:ATP-dependent Clp protease ATP-binding subunit ClpC